MKHRSKLDRLGRPTDQRMALLNNLARELIRHGQIVTTEARAKALAPYVESMIQRAISGQMKDFRVINDNLNSRRLVFHLSHEIVPKLTRKTGGGYTTIVKMPPRRGDAAPLSMIRINYERAE